MGKTSAAVGLAGLTPQEAAKGALLCKDFQKMPDPFGDVIREVKVSTVVYFLMYHVTLQYCNTVEYRTHQTSTGQCFIHCYDFTHITQPHEKIEEASKSWFELGGFVGLDVIDDEEAEEVEQQEEEDKEVQRIISQGHETKRKLIRGTDKSDRSNSLCTVQYSTVKCTYKCRYMCECHKCQDKYIYKCMIFICSCTISCSWPSNCV